MQMLLSWRGTSVAAVSERKSRAVWQADSRARRNAAVKPEVRNGPGTEVVAEVGQRDNM
jgi:hypothetical protein